MEYKRKKFSMTTMQYRITGPLIVALSAVLLLTAPQRALALVSLNEVTMVVG